MTQTNYRGRKGTKKTHQFHDAAVLPDDPPGLPELGHVGDGLSRQSLELFDRVQQLDDALKTLLTDDSSEDFPVVTNSDQDFQRSDLIKEKSKPSWYYYFKKIIKYQHEVVSTQLFTAHLALHFNGVQQVEEDFKAGVLLDGQQAHLLGQIEVHHGVQSVHGGRLVAFLHSQSPELVSR